MRSGITAAEVMPIRRRTPVSQRKAEHAAHVIGTGPKKQSGARNRRELRKLDRAMSAITERLVSDMGDFLITEVGESREWTTPDGKKTFVYYDVIFHGEEGAGKASVKRGKGEPSPEPGETLEDYEIVHKGDKAELKKKNSGRPYGGSGKTGDFRSAEQIMRGDAHGKAMHWMDIKVAAGEFKAIDWPDYLKMVDAFYQDLKGAA